MKSVEDDLWSQAYRAVPVAELLPDLCCPSTGESLSHAATRFAGSCQSDLAPKSSPYRTGPGRPVPIRLPRLGHGRNDQSDCLANHPPRRAKAPHATAAYSYYDF